MPKRDVAELRARLAHPVIDADGHTVEFMPALAPYLEDEGIASADLARLFRGTAGPGARSWAQLTRVERERVRAMRPGWWIHPTRNTIDLASATFPSLLHERLDEIGIDLSVQYPSLGLAFLHTTDDDMRRRACRALNRYHADAFAPVSDRLVPAAVVPMHTPDEAIAELKYAVEELGFRTALIAGHVLRPVEDVAVRAPEVAGYATWLDLFGVDSLHDYDPVWQTVVDLDIGIAAHSMGMGWGSRRSTSSYVFNHVGHFASAGEALCKALLLGGVATRFPDLRIAFLEGGVGWACSLYADLIGHWNKRSGEAIFNYAPGNVDRALFAELYERYGRELCREPLTASLTRARPAGTETVLDRWEPDSLERVMGIDGADPAALDEFASSGIRDASEIAATFRRSFFFGCEADDPLVATAFDRRVLPLGCQLNAMFGSDLGHWDVVEMSGLLCELHAPVEEGVLDDTDFATLVFDNAARFLGGRSRRFFAGTTVEAAVEARQVGGDR